ncbi:hypothetical protein KR51_00004990 [Rubidibacter lacunae KORDI 51-2]|uniref:Uncharacterized protein n=1 Tax=Rubidibacter lacunae KORDI 51-2 TaxID=582515 RepID=U5DQ95_9CHRO|nr:hypothetical protein KR51_00004990 [Rubidibacter lacunae KORDI 51-2]
MAIMPFSLSLATVLRTTLLPSVPVGKSPLTVDIICLQATESEGLTPIVIGIFHGYALTNS